jgi:serine/threonine-protein kinase
MRPADAFAARTEILALNWPLALAPAFGAPSAAMTAPELVHTAGGHRPRDRLEAASDGTEIDTWTGRAIQRVPLSAATLARARAFSLADHAALQPVLRVDREGAAVWLLAMRNHPLSRPLAGDERSRLADALAALHAAGSAHGAVDALHVTIDRTAGIVLCFGWHFPPTFDADATFDGDRQALARLP